MIEVTDMQGLKHFINPAFVLFVSQTSEKKRYSGPQSLICLTDGSAFEVVEKHDAIAAMIK